MQKKEHVFNSTGAYTLDCYCKWKNDEHEYNEFPHQFTRPTRAKARREARKRGWILHRDYTGTCPKCAEKIRI